MFNILSAITMYNNIDGLHDLHYTVIIQKWVQSPEWMDIPLNRFPLYDYGKEVNNKYIS